ncbi:CcdC protein domain-containing protein [Bacillus mexicanus]|uniref:CcdC protein domain-containing protein n=1 Tax=Bacillus mexicanus TaxID=2834415 RepID=UPI003D223344
MVIIGFITVILIYLVILALFYRYKKKQKDKPIKRNGYGILAPIPIFFVLFGFITYEMAATAGNDFVVPAIWEILIAAVLGLIFGYIMITQTFYEKREDGLIYSKPNKNFKYVIIAIIVIRLALTQYFKDLNQYEMLILAYSLAFAYLSVWRIGSFIKFRKIHKS